MNGLNYDENFVYTDYYRLWAIGGHKVDWVRYDICYFCLRTFDPELSWWDCENKHQATLKSVIY